MFASAPRGKFRELRLREGGDRVAVRARGCRVVWEPHPAGGGGGHPAGGGGGEPGALYATLDLTPDERALAVLRLADDEIRRLAAPRFTPLRDAGRAVVVKLARGLAWPAGAAAVDVVLSPGPFGAFGYCLTITECHRHSAAAP